MPRATAAGEGRPATIFEVARRAGVSHQTVSRYLRVPSTVRPATKERIQEAIDTLGYTPNLAARSMRTRLSNRIVLLLPDTSSIVPTDVVHGAADAAHEAGFVLDVVGVGGDSEQRAEKAITLLGDRQLAGVLSLAPLADIETRLAAMPHHIPILVAEEYDDQMRTQATLADGSAAGQVVEYLAGLGHRRLLHLGGPESWPAARNRRAAYQEAVERLGLLSAGSVCGDWSAESGYQLSRLAVDLRAEGEPVTAIVAANDRMALGAIRSLADHGLGVPSDISVFGWDDIEQGRFALPSLSTVRMCREETGRDAVVELIGMIRGGPVPRQVRELVTELIVRESTGPVRPVGR